MLYDEVDGCSFYDYIFPDNQKQALKMLVAQLVSHQALHSQQTGNTKGIVHGFSLSPLPCGLCRIYSLLSQIFSLPAMAPQLLEKLFAASRRSPSFFASTGCMGWSKVRAKPLLHPHECFDSLKAADFRPPLQTVKKPI